MECAHHILLVAHGLHLTTPPYLRYCMHVLCQCPHALNSGGIPCSPNLTAHSRHEALWQKAWENTRIGDDDTRHDNCLTHGLYWKLSLHILSLDKGDLACQSCGTCSTELSAVR